MAAHVYPHVGRLRTVLEFGAPTHVGGMRGSLGRLRTWVGLRPRTVLEIVSRLRRPPDTARVVTGTRKFDCGLGHDELHWLDVPDQAGSSVSEPPRTCRTTASRSPVLSLGDICVRPIVNYLQCLNTYGRRAFQLPVWKDPTTSADCFRRLLKIRSILSALEVPALYKFTYLLIHSRMCVGVCAAYARGWAAATQRFSDEPISSTNASLMCSDRRMR